MITDTDVLALLCILLALCAATGMSQSEVIQTALDRFHQAEMIQAWQVADGDELPPDYEPTAEDDDSELP